MDCSAAARLGWIALWLVLPTVARADDDAWPPTLTEIGRTIQGYAAAGMAGYALGDFDGDGRIDMVIPGDAGSYNVADGSLLQVVGAVGDEIRVKQSIVLRTPEISRVVAWTPPGDRAHLLSIAANGVATEWSGWPLQPVRSFAVDTGISAAAIDDIDNDGALELVTIQPAGVGRLAVYGLANGQPKWARPGLGGSDLLLAQLDGDPALEIVIAATPGVVVDGATQANEWTHADGFGAYLAAGRLLGNGATQFAAARYWDLFGVFRGNPWSPVWSLAVPRDNDALAVADLDGDGRDEIIRADGQWGSVHVYDSVTRQVRRTIPNPGHGVARIAAVDLLGTGQPAIAFSPRSINFREEPLLQLSSPLDGRTLYSLPLLPRPYSPVLLGELGGDGRLQLVHATHGDDPSIHIVDVQSGAELWRSPKPAAVTDDPFSSMHPQSFQLATAPGGARQLLVAGTVIYNGQILAIDGDTHAIRWRAGGYSSPVMLHRAIQGSTLVDFDADGIQDIAVCASGGAPGARILVFSGRDGSLLWQSISIGTNTRCMGILAGEFGGAAQLVAVLADGLYAFNQHTYLLDWTMPMEAEGASLVSGVAGPEIAIRAGTSLRFHDAANRALLRTINFNTWIASIRQLDADIHRLLVATNGVLQLVDGATGQRRVLADYLGEWSYGDLGYRIGDYSYFDAAAAGPGAYLIGAGTQTGVFRFHLALTEGIFGDGFESTP